MGHLVGSPRDHGRTGEHSSSARVLRRLLLAAGGCEHGVCHGRLEEGVVLFERGVGVVVHKAAERRVDVVGLRKAVAALRLQDEAVVHLALRPAKTRAKRGYEALTNKQQCRADLAVPPGTRGTGLNANINDPSITRSR